jgi:hypothetical protein
MQASVPFNPPRGVLRLFQALAVVGGITLVAGLSLIPERTWANMLLASNYLVGLALGGLVLVALHYVTGARWSVPLRRLPEAMAVALPLAVAGLLAVLVLQPALYSWSAPVPTGEEHVSALRAFWLERPFFLVRALAYVAIWLTFAALIVRNSRRQDLTAEPRLTGKNVRLSAGFLVAFGVTCWLSSYDWIMSLEPDWSSTIFGVYNFSGLFLSALAGVALLAICLRRQASLKALITEDRLHDLGTLVFAFSSFWMYTWFCQYLLIWYTNHPEETSYLVRRWQGFWPAVGLIDVVLNWGIPFVVLLFRAAKRSPVVLAVVCLVVLVGRWVDLYLMIFPSQGAAVTLPGPAEAGIILGAVGVFTLAVLHTLGKASLVPIHDPRY